MNQLKNLDATFYDIGQPLRFAEFLGAIVNVVQNLFRCGTLVGDRGETQSGVIPQIVVIELARRHIEARAHAVEYSINNGALIFQRMRVMQQQLQC